MRYVSPAWLFNGHLPSPLINPSDIKSLQLQKKKLLAELELSATGEIKINDRALSKNDILQYFETLEDETILCYHEAVSKDRTLLEFLESGRLSAEAVFAPSSLYDDARFLQWISAYFYTAFTEYVYLCLENTDEDSLQTILQNRLLLTDTHRENAWLQIIQMLEDNIAQLELYQAQHKKKQTLFADDISVLITEPLTRMILLFPERLFNGVRVKYAFAIMQVCIYTFNNHKNHRDFIDPWMEIAKTLAASETVAEELASKQEEMKKLREKARRSVLIRGALLLFFILAKFLPFVNSSPPDYNFPKTTTVVYNGDTIHNGAELDSAMHKHKHPAADSTHNTGARLK